jgi:hypothetical protein
LKSVASQKPTPTTCRCPPTSAIPAPTLAAPCHKDTRNKRRREQKKRLSHFCISLRYGQRRKIHHKNNGAIPRSPHTHDRAARL